MTALQWIIKEAKSLKSKYPKRFAKWTEYVAQASAIYASKHKGISPVGKKKVGAVKKKASKKKIAKKIAKKKVAKKKVSKKLGKVTLKKANYHPRDERYIIMNDGVKHLEGKPFFKETAKEIASALRKVKAKRKISANKQMYMSGTGNINHNYIKELSNFNNELEIAKKHIISLKGFKKQDPKYFKEGYKQELLDRYINRVKYLKSQIIQIKRQIK